MVSPPSNLKWYHKLHNLLNLSGYLALLYLSVLDLIKSDHFLIFISRLHKHLVVNIASTSIFMQEKKSYRDARQQEKGRGKQDHFGSGWEKLIETEIERKGESWMTNWVQGSEIYVQRLRFYARHLPTLSRLRLQRCLVSTLPCPSNYFSMNSRFLFFLIFYNGRTCLWQHLSTKI